MTSRLRPYTDRHWANIIGYSALLAGAALWRLGRHLRKAQR
jgi:hypothetical protein